MSPTRNGCDLPELYAKFDLQRALGKPPRSEFRREVSRNTLHGETSEDNLPTSEKKKKALRKRRYDLTAKEDEQARQELFRTEYAHCKANIKSHTLREGGEVERRIAEEEAAENATRGRRKMPDEASLMKEDEHYMPSSSMRK